MVTVSSARRASVASPSTAAKRSRSRRSASAKRSRPASEATKDTPLPSAGAVPRSIQPWRSRPVVSADMAGRLTAL